MRAAASPLPGRADAGDRALVLGIETATLLGGVGVVAGDGIRGEMTLRSPECHSERILPAVERLLSALGAARAQIAAVAVSSGPGSFTGLRTGIASAKGLAFSLGVPLYGIPTLEVLAANVACEDRPVCAVLDARRGEVFRAVFRRTAAGLEPLLPEAAVAAARLARELPEGCVVVGDRTPAVTRGIASRPDLRLAPPHLCHPRAAAVALLGLEAWRSGRPTELASLLPRYLRLSDAEAGARAASAAEITCADKGLQSVDGLVDNPRPFR